MRRMFDAIAFRYDLINRLFSFRRDVSWRRLLAAALPCQPGLRVLDVASGTGDVALMLLRQRPDIARVVGIDISQGMLQSAARKLSRSALSERSVLVVMDAAALAFPDASVDAVTAAFGVRNFADLDSGLAEMHRVLRPGGRALILEFSLPANPLIRTCYLLYFRRLLPWAAGVISRQPAAYRYLNQSVEAFPYNEAFCRILMRAGFVAAETHPLTFGIAALYIARKGD